MTVKTICVAVVLSFIAYHVDAERSKLVEIACKRNPALSFCKDDDATPSNITSSTSEPLPELPTTVATDSAHAKDQSPEKKREKEHSSEEEEESTTMRPRRKKTKRKSRRRHDSSESEEEERPKRPRRRKHRRDSSDESVEETRPRPSRRRPKSKPKRHSSEEAFLQPSKSDRSDEETPDDPVLDEPVPSQSSPAVPKEHLGSLLRLPRPVVTSSRTSQSVKDDESDESLISPPALPRRRVETNDHDEGRELLSSQRREKADPKIAVFITKFCVLERQRFIDKCRGEVNPKDVPFCKQYPPSCKSIDGVIPVIAYCDRYQRHYGKYCFADSRSQRTRTIKEFCKAFDQFCDNPAASMTTREEKVEQRTPVEDDKPPSSSPGRTLRRCKDVVDEARRVCHPPPPADDESNTRRCQAFLKSCATYVDWLKPTL